MRGKATHRIPGHRGSTCGRNARLSIQLDRSTLTADEILMTVDPRLLLLGAVFAGMAWGARAYRARDRRCDMTRVASAHGLRSGLTDPYGSSRLLFDRFNDGVERHFGPYVFAAGSTAQVRAFEYWFETEDSEGNRHRHWSSCIAGTLPVWAPYLVVNRESFATRVFDTVASTDIEVESEEFNRMFYVRCADRRFATLFLTPAMIDLLLSTQGLFEIEVHGDTFCLTTQRAKPEQYPPLLTLGARFAATAPADLANVYEPRFS
jgi:hypothetical protein